MEIIFRKITLEDQGEIVDLFINLYKNEPWNETWDKNIAQNKIDDFLNSNITENYCVTDMDNKIIGVLLGRRQYYIDGKELYVDEFFVDTNYQNQGIGKKFMEFIEEEMKQKEYSCIILLTEKSFPSEYFYSKIGFKTKDETIFMYKGI